MINLKRKMHKGYYRHYRSRQIYQLVGIAKNKSNSDKEVVIYKDSKDKLFVRDKIEFNRDVLHNGKLQPRFEYMGRSKKKLPINVSDVPAEPKGQIINS